MTTRDPWGRTETAQERVDNADRALVLAHYTDAPADHVRRAFDEFLLAITNRHQSGAPTMEELVSLDKTEWPELTATEFLAQLDAPACDVHATANKRRRFRRHARQ